jgi:5'-phosphate synthase pdxT subunit
MPGTVDKTSKLIGAEQSSRPVVNIGVLALQGDFQKHLEMCELIDGVDARIVKTVEEIQACDGLVIPGGESTTVGKLMERYGIDEAVRKRVAQGMAVFGTCMGMIMLATDIEGSDQQRLGLIDMTVRRNAFGRQVDSFETDLSIDAIGETPVRAVFIRAPFITSVHGDTKILATLETGEIVMVRQGNCLAAAFHPELTEDIRVHEYFANIAAASRAAVRN